MRAKEFVINIPITISFNGDGDPEVSVASKEEPEDENNVFIPPLQQALELQKDQSGKNSEIITQVIANDDDERS